VRRQFGLANIFKFFSEFYSSPNVNGREWVALTIYANAPQNVSLFGRPNQQFRAVDNPVSLQDG
jgi:hypothetical protein